MNGLTEECDNKVGTTAVKLWNVSRKVQLNFLTNRNLNGFIISKILKLMIESGWIYLSVRVSRTEYQYIRFVWLDSLNFQTQKLLCWI